MTIQEQISECLTDAKAYSITWMNQIIAKENNGIDTCCDQDEITMYVQWIDILQDFYNKKYLGLDYYGKQYLTVDKAILLMGRINSRDFKKQTELDQTTDGAFDSSFDDSFST